MIPDITKRQTNSSEKCLNSFEVKYTARSPFPCYSTERGERRSRRLRRRSGRSPPSGGLSSVGVGGGRVGLTPGVDLAARVYSLVC